MGQVPQRLTQQIPQTPKQAFCAESPAQKACRAVATIRTVGSAKLTRAPGRTGSGGGPRYRARTHWLADAYGRPLPPDDPLAPLARDIARALTEPDFALHHCAQSHPLYRLGGVCLVPVARGHDPDGRGGAVISWTTHDLLSISWDRWREYQGAREVMNGGLA